MVSSSSPWLKTKISTSFANFDFSFPLIYLLLLFSLKDQRFKLFAKRFVKSFIAFAWQLDDGPFIGLSDKVKNFSYFFSSVVPLSMIVSPWYYNESFLAYSSLFFLTSRPFPNPVNVTHSYMYYPCKKFFFLHIQPLLKNNHKHNMTSIHCMKSLSISFVGTCIVVSWCRSLTFDPIIVPN
jgi:hypothetical protein